MRHVRVALIAALSLACGCALAERPPPLPPPSATGPVAVFAPNNRTGDDLLVAGASFLEQYALKSDRITVPDVLASEARLQLARRGFAVVPAGEVDAATGGRPVATAAEAAADAARGRLQGAALYIEIRRWEPDVPLRPSFVIVSVQMTLIDPTTRRVLWHADHPARPVRTDGVVNTGDAYIVAARKVVAEMIGDASQS